MTRGHNALFCDKIALIEVKTFAVTFHVTADIMISLPVSLFIYLMNWFSYTHDFKK